MNLNKIQSITFSLLKKETDPNKYNKAEYSKKKTVKFTLPSDFSQTEKMIEALVKDMYVDLMQNAPDGCDSLGLWIEMDTITIDNAISLQTLDDITIYSNNTNMNSIYEFFKMTLQ